MKSIKKYSMIVLATFIMLGLIGFAEATPTVVSVTPSSLAEADVGNVYVNVTFDEEMNQSQNVTIFVVGITGSPIEVTFDNWNSSTSWIGNFTFSDNNETLVNAFYNISGAMNSSGDVMVELSSRGANNALDIDTVKPTVVNISVNDSLITEGDVEVDGFGITVDFSEAMDNGTAATVSFDPAVGTTLTNCAGDWSNSTRYVRTCDVEDGDYEWEGVGIDISDAKDAVGNTMTADTSTGTDVFNIDTIAPEITAAGTINLTSDLNGDGVAGIGDNLTYTEGTISSADGDSWTVDLSAYGLSAAATSGTYTVIVGNDAGAFSATEIVTDDNGNTDTGSVSLDFTNIDNERPTGTITVDTESIYEDDLVQVVTVTYDEAMDNASAPTIEFTGNESEITSQGDGAWNEANTTWTETFDVTDNNKETTGISVSSADATDLAGNDEGAGVPDTFDIDTVSPIVVVTLSDYELKAGDVAVVTFTFSEAPIGFNESDITVASGNLSNLTNSSETVYTAIFVPTTDNNTNVITVGTNWTDSGLNYPASQTNSSNYVIDTVVPTVEITEPSSGASVRSTAVISFTSTESVDVECSVDNSNWVDCTSGVTTLGSVTGFSGLSTGAFTLYLRDTDSAGNIGEDSISLTKLSTSSGGGSARSYQVRNNFQAHQSWIMILPNQRILFKPGISENPVEEVNFVMKRNKAALTLNTTGYSSKPAGIREKKGALKYMEINADNLSGADVNGSITVKFSLEKSLTNNSRRIYMFRLVGDTWNKLTTIYLYSNATHYFYSANTPGFSYFAIGEEDVVTTDVSSSAPLAPVTPTAPVASSTQTGEGSAGSDLGSQETAEPQVQENNAQVQDESATKSKFSIGDIKGWIWFLVVVVVLGLLVAISISKSKYR